MIHTNKKDIQMILIILLFTLRSMALFLNNSFVSGTTRLIMPIPFCFFAFILLKNRTIGSISKLVVLFYLALLPATLMISKGYIAFYSYAIQGIGITILCNYYMSIDCKRFVYNMRNTMAFLVGSNVLMQFILPNGVLLRNGQRAYIVGSRIGFTTPYILCIFLFVLYNIEKERKNIVSKATIGIYVLCGISLLAQRVSTGIIAIVIIGAIFLCINSRYLSKILNYWILLIISSVLFIVITMANRITFIKPILELLGEDLTFNNRTYIWNSAIENIKAHPFLGNGVTNTGSFTIIYNNYIGESRPAHNNFLHILFEGGFLSLAVYIIILVYIGILVNKCKNYKLKTLISGIIFTLNIVSITEIQMQRGWIFFILAISVFALLEEHLKKNSKEVYNATYR